MLHLSRCVLENTPNLAPTGEDGSYGERGQAVFGANYERLVGMKRKYDPMNAFGKGHLLAPQFDGKLVPELSYFNLTRLRSYSWQAKISRPILRYRLDALQTSVVNLVLFR